MITLRALRWADDLGGADVITRIIRGGTRRTRVVGDIPWWPEDRVK